MNKGLFWILLVIGLLAGNGVAMAVLIAESGDPSDRVLPDYYRRAVAYDDTIAALRASDELGWQVGSRLVAAAPGRARLAVTIADGAGAPVAGGSVEAEVRHRSVGTPVAFALVEQAPGRYEVELPVAAVGLFVVDVRARRGEDHYAGHATVELEAR